MLLNVLAFLIVLLFIGLIFITYQFFGTARYNTQLLDNTVILREQLDACHKSIDELQQQLESEVIRNSTILSQKKSSETKIGTMVENVIPLLTDLPYNTSDMKHLGMPIDFICFCYDKEEIVFLEVKSGNAKESKRQKLVKDIISKGKVHYDLMQVNSSGIKVTRKV